MKMNFADVKKFEFSLLPVGTYSAKTVAVVEATSSNDNPMWNIQWLITDEEYFNRRLYGRIVWTVGAKPFIQNMLGGYAPTLDLDLTGEDGFEVNLHLNAEDEPEEAGFESSDLLDVEVNLLVSQETITTVDKTDPKKTTTKLVNTVKATMPI